MIENILRDLIQIDTRNSRFNETEAAVYLKSLCDKNEIENEIVEPIKGKGNFIAHIPGWDINKKELLLLSHLDTADFGDLKKWVSSPLSATEYNGRIIGRGAIDCKGLVSIWLTILIHIRQKGLQPERGIIFAAVADEENGSQYGMEYLIENNQLIKNCGYVIGEGGGYPIFIDGNTYYTCQNAEKSSTSYQVDTVPKCLEYNREIHVGHPLLNLLTGLFTTKIYNMDLVCFLIKQALSNSQKRGIDIKTLLCDSYSMEENDKEVLLTKHQIPNSHSRDSIGVCKKLESIISKLVLKSHIPANYSSLDEELYSVIVSETKKVSPKSNVIPYTTPGYSDNRYLRDLKRSVYGYFPLSLEDNLSGIHGYNENISIQGLRNAYILLNNIVLEFTKQYKLVQQDNNVKHEH